MSQENVDLPYRAIDAMNRRDLGAFLALMDDDVEAVPRIVAMEGGLHGHDGIRRWWENWFDVFPDYDIEVVEVRDLGDVTVAALRALGHGAAATCPSRTRSGKQAGGGAGSSSGGAPSTRGTKPSKPPGCRSRPSISQLQLPFGRNRRVYGFRYSSFMLGAVLRQTLTVQGPLPLFRNCRHSTSKVAVLIGRFRLAPSAAHRSMSWTLVSIAF